MSKIKPIGKKGKQDCKEQAVVNSELTKIANGHCMRCGARPDFRGLQKHHKTFKSQGGKNTVENEELWCAPCHFGEEGHRTENVKRVVVRDRTNDFEKRGMKSARG